ncbi:hypothetical protein ACMXYO_02300 [Neptuniibacter sp. QD37_6]|uniref:hypothetical protein n=1 Tax=Neptuniibacter sp. QD37_6 TaxID=3398210 RepID=UPI0039F5BA59
MHQSGLSIEVLDGSFSNPLDLSIKGDKDFSAPELALMIREGMEYAAKNSAKAAVRAIRPKSTPDKPKRPILKLKK